MRTINATVGHSVERVLAARNLALLVGIRCKPHSLPGQDQTNQTPFDFALHHMNTKSTHKGTKHVRTTYGMALWRDGGFREDRLILDGLAGHDLLGVWMAIHPLASLRGGGSDVKAPTRLG
jgi:hypothetical protein